MMLAPRLKVSVSLSGIKYGRLELAASPLAVSTKLLPFFKGDPGPALDETNLGPGFKLVGQELRYDIASLPRG